MQNVQCTSCILHSFNLALPFLFNNTFYEIVKSHTSNFILKKIQHNY